jgi:hypothetical protein
MQHGAGGSDRMSRTKLYELAGWAAWAAFFAALIWIAWIGSGAPY